MVTNLITGGAGFIGSHLAEFLVELGQKVVVLDDLSTGSRENIAHLRNGDNLSVIVDSVLNGELVQRVTAECDRVFHLAAAVGVDLIVKQPARVIETNILGTDCVLRACCSHRVPVFLASTSEVYGKSTSVPFKEDDDLVLGPTTRSRWSYACSKAIDEFLALAYNSEHDLPVVVGRFFNTTGPRQTGQYGMVIPRFVEQALRGTPLTVYGTGDQVRCFAHVLDIVPAVVKLLETDAAYGKVVNLGGREPVTINELARKVRQLTGSESRIVHVPFEKAYIRGFEDIQEREPDIAKAGELIGFNPTRTLDDILNSVIRWKRDAMSTEA
jgi:UDP-glucose 4-epimerase